MRLYFASFFTDQDVQPDLVLQETVGFFQYSGQRYTYRVHQTIQMKLILLCVWAEPAVLGSTKTALKFKYEI